MFDYSDDDASFISKHNVVDKTQITKIINNLEGLSTELYSAYADYPGDQNGHDKKIRWVLFDLEIIDGKLSNILQVNHKDDEFSREFGVSVKLDTAKNKLKQLEKKHNNLNTEWLSQREHINKISKNISEKQAELKSQIRLCTHQGLILGKILWKLTEKDYILNNALSNEELLLEVIKVIGGCLYGFIQAYEHSEHEFHETFIDEYQYILCLCGIFSNLATTPDGRFFLLHKSTCANVFHQLIKILPNVLIPNAEDLKWIILLSIYNIITCEEGQNYVRTIPNLLPSLLECTEPPNTRRVVAIASKIISTVIFKNSAKVGAENICKHVLPIQLEQLRNNRKVDETKIHSINQMNHCQLYSQAIELKQTISQCEAKEINEDVVEVFENAYNENRISDCKIIEPISQISKTILEKPLREFSISVSTPTFHTFNEFLPSSKLILIDRSKSLQIFNPSEEFIPLNLKDESLSEIKTMVDKEENGIKTDNDKISISEYSFQTFETKCSQDKNINETKNFDNGVDEISNNLVFVDANDSLSVLNKLNSKSTVVYQNVIKSTNLGRKKIKKGPTYKLYAFFKKH